MPYGEFKIKKTYEKERKKFTSLNLLVDMNGEDVWLNGYLGKENRQWKEGDTVAVNYWFNDEKEWYQYKPAEEGDKSAANQQGQGPPPQSGSGVPNTPDNGETVSNKELKALIIRTGAFIKSEVADEIAELRKEVSALRASLDKTSHLSGEEKPPEKQAEKTKDERDYFDDIDDDLPF